MKGNQDYETHKMEIGESRLVDCDVDIRERIRRKAFDLQQGFFIFRADFAGRGGSRYLAAQHQRDQFVERCLLASERRDAQPVAQHSDAIGHL